MQDELEGLVVPSKLYGALGAGRPALFLGPSGSEAARVVREQDCGTVLSDPDGSTLADVIADWYGASDRWAAACDRAHAAVADGFAEAVDRFDDLLRATAPEDVSVEASR
jgi:hypothetical protein